MANTAEEAEEREKSARYRRGETVHNWLGELVDESSRVDLPLGWLDAWFERINDFVEDAVDTACCNGWNDAMRGSRGEPGARRPGEYRSALQNGKLHPAEREREGA